MNTNNYLPDKIDISFVNKALYITHYKITYKANLYNLSYNMVGTCYISKDSEGRVVIPRYKTSIYDWTNEEWKTIWSVVNGEKDDL